MLQKRFVLFLVVILVIATASIYQFTATAETSLPPTPNYIPASILLPRAKPYGALLTRLYGG